MIIKRIVRLKRKRGNKHEVQYDSIAVELLEVEVRNTDIEQIYAFCNQAIFRGLLINVPDKFSLSSSVNSSINMKTFQKQLSYVHK